jgi:hypothetical protein
VILAFEARNELLFAVWFRDQLGEKDRTVTFITMTTVDHGPYSRTVRRYP